MFDSILGNLFGNKTETKKSVSSSILNRIRKRKSIIQKFKNINPNDNLKRAKIAKELLNVSKTEGERKAARKFYKDEASLNSLKNKIKASNSINEKLSLARQGKRLATKQQKEFWENLINRLQKKKQEKKDVISEKKALTVDTDKEQDMEKDTEEIKEEQEIDIDKNESEEDSGNDTKETEKDDENEEEIEEDGEEGESEEDGDEDEDEDDGEGENDEWDGTQGNNIDNSDHDITSDDNENNNENKN